MKKIIKHYPMTDRLIVRRGYIQIGWLIIAQCPASSILALFRTRIQSSRIYKNYIEIKANDFWLPLKRYGGFGKDETFRLLQRLQYMVMKLPSYERVTPPIGIIYYDVQWCIMGKCLGRRWGQVTFGHR
jgi:hypothetical protein